MSIIYALIARSSDVVLSEYTEFSGNFQQISRIIMRKMKKNSKYTLSYDKHKFHYHNENDITYLMMSDNLADEVAFSFLSDVRKKFMQTYNFDSIANFHAYQLNEFNEQLKILITYYNNNPKYTKSGELIKELNEAKGIMVENIEKLFDRDEKLNIIAMKSQNLNQRSVNVHYQSASVKKKEREKYYKMMMMVGGGVAVFVFLLFFLII